MDGICLILNRFFTVTWEWFVIVTVRDNIVNTLVKEVMNRGKRRLLLRKFVLEMTFNFIATKRVSCVG
jgi:hypothetical protein